MEDKFSDYKAKNVNINKALAYVDSELNFVSTKENFRRFLGFKREHDCLYKLISQSDVAVLKERLVDIKDNESICIVTYMYRADEEYRRVSLKIKKLSDTEKNNCSYSVELIDLGNVHEYVYDLEFKLLKYKNVLEKQGKMILEYNASTDVLKIFSLETTCEHVIFSAKVSELRHQIPDMDITEDDKQTLIFLCASLINNDKYIEYVFSKNPFIKNAAEGEVVVKGNTITLSDIAIITIGSVGSHTGDFYMTGLNNMDIMTGLLNKSAIINLAKKAINEKQYDQIFLVMIDLDNFKLVNDNYGHMQGDEVIKTISDMLKNDIKQNGWVGRFGGDEYFAVLYNLGGEGDLRTVLGTILDHIKQSYQDKFEGFNLTCSMGISEYPRNGDNFDLLFKKADRGLYIAKRKGKNRYIIYKEELHGEITVDDDIEYDIEENGPKKIAGNIKRFDIMRRGIASVATEGADAVDNFINEIIEAYCLTGISIYSGEEFKLFKQWGNYSTPMDNADYMKHKTAIARFDDKGIFCEHNVKYNGNYVPIMHNKLLHYNIYSTVQCIIGTREDIKAIVTFDMEEPTRNWTEEDDNYFGIISQLVSKSLNII